MIDNLYINWRSALMFAVCFSLFLVTLRLLFRQTERTANSLLAAFLVAIILVQMPQIIGFSGAYSKYPSLGFFPFFTELYFGPLIYLHSFALMRAEKIGLRWLWLAPGFAQTLYYSVIFLAVPDLTVREKWFEAAHAPYIAPLITILSVALGVYCLWKVYKLIQEYGAYLKQTESALLMFDPVWLRQLLIWSSLVAFIYFAFTFYTWFVSSLSYFEAFKFQLIMALIVAWMGLDAASRTHIEFPKMLRDWHSSQGDSSDIDNSAEENWADLGQRILEKMQSEQLYLNPTLSLKTVARAMISNESYVSKAINRGLGTNFNALVNQMRVDHAKRSLCESDESIIEIALASGFNSKPTFNRVFKEKVGITPSQFRNSENAE